MAGTLLLALTSLVVFGLCLGTVRGLRDGSLLAPSLWRPSRPWQAEADCKSAAKCELLVLFLIRLFGKNLSENRPKPEKTSRIAFWVACDGLKEALGG